MGDLRSGEIRKVPKRGRSVKKTRRISGRGKGNCAGRGQRKGRKEGFLKSHLMLMEESRVERRGRRGGRGEEERGSDGEKGEGGGWGEGKRGGGGRGRGAAESSIHVGAGGRREHAFLCCLPQALPRADGDTLLNGETEAETPDL